MFEEVFVASISYKIKLPNLETEHKISCYEDATIAGIFEVESFDSFCATICLIVRNIAKYY